MKRPGRGLSPDEAALWARVASTVVPLEGRKVTVQPVAVQIAPKQASQRAAHVPIQPALGASSPKAEELRPRTRHGLDAGWDRKLARGIVQPDFTLDLHGATLDAAHARLEHGLTQAAAQGARVVLLITGRDRPSEDRRGRGAIRRKFLDWLMAGPHAGRIAAIRPAHPRHGGAGAVYLVLRRAR